MLHDGELVASDVAATFDRDKNIRAMVGRLLSSPLYGKHSGNGALPTGEKVLTVQNLSMGNMVRNTSFVYSGQSPEDRNENCR